MPQCIPIRDLKNTGEISQMCHQANEPIYVTKNGYRDLVIMSGEMYDKMRLYSVYEKLLEAEQDIERGRIADACSSLKDIRAKYGI